MSTIEKTYLTPDQAIALLGDSESIHTFRSTAISLIGADWDRPDLVDAIERAGKAEVGGQACRAMGHGLVVWTGDDPLFIQCDDAALESLAPRGALDESEGP